MSIQTAAPQTDRQQEAAAVLARRRAFINQNAAGITVQIERDGATVSVLLNTLPPTERARAITRLMEEPPANMLAPAPQLTRQEISDAVQKAITVPATRQEFSDAVQKAIPIPAAAPKNPARKKAARTTATAKKKK